VQGRGAELATFCLGGRLNAGKFFQHQMNFYNEKISIALDPLSKAKRFLGE
jgi:hypothetical protein